MDKYSYFLTTKPRYKWQWAFLLPMRLVLRMKSLALKIDSTGELFGVLALMILAFGCMAGLIVM